MPVFLGHGINTMLEINPLLNQLRDIETRSDVLRGYL